MQQVQFSNHVKQLLSGVLRNDSRLRDSGDRDTAAVAHLISLPDDRCARSSPTDDGRTSCENSPGRSTTLGRNTTIWRYERRKNASRRSWSVNTASWQDGSAAAAPTAVGRQTSATPTRSSIAQSLCVARLNTKQGAFVRAGDASPPQWATPARRSRASSVEWTHSAVQPPFSCSTWEVNHSGSASAVNPRPAPAFRVASEIYTIRWTKILAQFLYAL